ncbi:hypothetical protein D3C78_910740 [compost metagenome]
MHAHAGTEHDFTRNIRRFRHLHHLAEHQLLDQRRIDASAGQQFTHRRFTQIYRRNTVISGRLFGKGGAQSIYNRNTVTVTGHQRQCLTHKRS